MRMQADGGESDRVTSSTVYTDIDIDYRLLIRFKKQLVGKGIKCDENGMRVSGEVAGEEVPVESGCGTAFSFRWIGLEGTGMYSYCTVLERVPASWTGCCPPDFDRIWRSERHA